MGRVAVDVGVGQDAKCSVDIRSDPGQASNADRRQNQRNRRRREAEGQLAASLGRYSPLRGMRLPRFLPSALLPLRATHPSISTASQGTGEWGHSRFFPAAVFLAAGDSKWRIAETLLISRGYIRL